MDPLTLVFYLLMAVLGLVVAWFLLAFVRLLLLYLLKLVVLFLPLIVALPIAAWFWLEKETIIAGGVLVAGFGASIGWYPRKEKGVVEEVGQAYYTWPKTPRGRMLNFIDKRIAKTG